jgi:hypothetical protein
METPEVSEAIFRDFLQEATPHGESPELRYVNHSCGTRFWASHVVTALPHLFLSSLNDEMNEIKTWIQSASLATLLVAAVSPVMAGDLSDAIPPDVFLAIYGKHNPERDYQKAYYNEIREAVEKSRIIERTVQIVQSRASEADVAQLLTVRDTLKKAVEPIEWEHLANCSEVVYCQKFEGVKFDALKPQGFTSQHLVMARFPENGAASLAEGIINLFRLAEEAAGGNLTVVEETQNDTQLTTLQLPPRVPFNPVIGIRGDLFVFSTDPTMLKQGLTLLDNPDKESKFDDARFKEAMSHLPEAEDAVVFFDGQTMFRNLNGLVALIQRVGTGNDEAQRVAQLLQSFLSEVSIIDYEVTVEYTDGYTNRSDSFGKAAADFREKTFGKMLADQEPFKDWSKWVPATASSFSLNSGATLHPLYEWVTQKVPEIFPESQQAFDHLAALQETYDVHLNEDLLQGFGGESVSVSFPGPPTPFGQSQQSAMFLRCEKPDRIRALIHRGVAVLQQIPQVRAQGLTIKESARLEGFEELSAGIFLMMGGMTPTIGFQDGWMALGSHADAIESVMMTKEGENESFATSDTFAQFGLEVTGDVHAISYSNTGESIRQFGKGLQQVGSMLPMLIGMADQGNNGPDLAPVQDVLSLLPSIGRIIEKFDFVESKLSVKQPGPTEDTFVRHNVIMIRPPESASDEAPSRR